MSGLSADLRTALRSLRAAPLLTAVAVLSLALGIGANTALFAIINSLLLRPLPVAAPERLVTISSDTAVARGFSAGAGWSYGMWSRLQPRTQAFDGALAWMTQRLDLSEGGESQPVDGVLASGDFFTVLGAQAIVGRVFTAADDVRGGGPDGPVAVISHRLWQRRFNGATTIAGTRLTIEGVPFTMVGVTPPAFVGLDVGQPFDVALPLQTEPLIGGARSVVNTANVLLLGVMLRLKRGQSQQAANAELRAMQPEILGQNVPTFLEEPFTVVPATTGISDRSQLRQRFEQPLFALLAIAALVLLTACANIANLLLARAHGRRHELSVRLALGASRVRLARYLLIESIVIAGAGAVTGALFARWASGSLVAQLSMANAPVWLDLSLDVRVLSFAGAVTMLTAMLFGVAPAFHAGRSSAHDALKDDGMRATSHRQGVSGALVAVQVALSLVLIVAAALFLRTFAALAHVPLGFAAERVLVVQVNTARAAVPAAERPELIERLIDAVRQVPGVAAAAGSTWTPMSGGGGLMTDAAGRLIDPEKRVGFNFITTGWFDAYGIPLRAGRDFHRSDTSTSARVVVVNDAFVRRFYSGRQVEGRITEESACGRDRPCTIVGVVADAAYARSPRDVPPPTIYIPMAQSAGMAPPTSAVRISVRSIAGQPSLLAPALAAALSQVDRGVTFTFRPLADDVAATMSQERLVAMISGFFGMLGVTLAALGLFALTWNGVTRRTKEIGIRLALGATPSRVVRLILRRIVWLVSIGIVAGTVASAWLSRFVAPLLYGLEPRDPFTFISAVAGLGAVAATAGWLAASRASKINPANTLRNE